MYDRRKSSHKISSELYIMRTVYIVILQHWQWYAKLFFGVFMYMMASGPTKRKQRYLVCIVLWRGLLTNEKVALDDRRISTSRHTVSQNDGRCREGRISSKKENEKWKRKAEDTRARLFTVNRTRCFCPSRLCVNWPRPKRISPI